MKRQIENLTKYILQKMLFISICVILICISSKDTYALTASQYDRFVEEGRLGNLNIEVNAKGQMFRKFGHFIIDGEYTGGDANNPFYNEENSRDLAILAVPGNSVYEVYGEIDYDAIDYSYEDDETLNATQYDRATFEARVERMDYGNTYKSAIGYGKYNLRQGKNLTAFVKFAYDFYKNNSGETRVGCINEIDLSTRGLTSNKICPMELLEEYANVSYIDSSKDAGLKDVWDKCTKEWEYEGTILSNTENIFEHLQDIFMCYVYLKPGVDKIRSTIGLDTSELSDSDYGAILSMMYERFGGRPINPSRVETGNAIPVIGTGDVLPALVDLSGTELSDMTIADKIYTCMIEVKYKNNDLKLASWLKEAEEVNGGYDILDAKEYDIYMKAYQKAFQLYGQDTANDTLLDYGCVLTPDIFESKKSFNEALNDFARTIRRHFGDSSFYHNRDNANYVARSYMMAKKMCENSQFADITDIYACDMDVVEHTYGYDSSNIILLADTQVVQLNDSYGEDCDTDQDGINDNVEAHTPEEVDITNFLKEYCKYNKYTPEETADMIAKNSKVVMYNYSSNPILPDSDFDGRDDLRDGRKLDNEYNSTNETDNYSNIKIRFNQDYRYFFMESTKYYEELAEMGLILSNMASKKKKNNIYVNKSWVNNNSGEHYTANNLYDYMWYIGMEHIVDHTYENVPYILGNHDTIALLGKVNNLERNVITLVIGENENYKDILAANYDGSLGSGSGDDIHHQGYDYHAQQIYEQLVNYDNSQTADRWKKSYWIVGYGTGGSVANLVAKKFIDYKHVNTNVYCYTYQAPNTINRNNLIKRIANVKYQSIFNIENTDDIMLNLMGDEAGWTKYGVLKRLSVGDDKKTKQSWNRLTGDSYGGGTSFLSNFFDNIFNYFSEGMVSGFAGTWSTNVIWHTSGWDSNEMVKIILAEEISEFNSVVSEEIRELVNNEKIKEAATKIKRKGEKVINQARDGTTLVYPYSAYTVPNDFIGLPTRHGGDSVILPYIMETAKFYINYIGSYQGEKQTDDSGNVRATNKAALYYDYITTYKNDSNKRYPFDIYDFPEATTIEDIDNPTYYTTTEKAYIPLTGKNIYYYDKFKDLSTDEFMANVIKNGTRKSLDYNYNSHYIGDDCTGFSQGVIYSFEMSKDSDEPRGMYGIAGSGFGIYNHNENASKYQTDSNTEMSLKNLGYVKYSAENKTIDWLQPGDLLCSQDHVEYYVGNNFETEYKETTETNRQMKKKAGVEEINRSTDRILTKTIYSYDKNTGIYIDSGIPAAQGTFGWGGVNDDFPIENANQEMCYFYKVEDIFRKCSCGCTGDMTVKENHSSNCQRNNIDGKHDYSIIWRYER